MAAQFLVFLRLDVILGRICDLLVKVPSCLQADVLR